MKSASLLLCICASTRFRSTSQLCPAFKPTSCKANSIPNMSPSFATRRPWQLWMHISYRDIDSPYRHHDCSGGRIDEILIKLLHGSYTYVTRSLIAFGLDELAPPSAIKLTDGGEGMGCVYVYDAETCE